jgi:hypothetical protein
MRSTLPSPAITFPARRNRARADDGCHRDKEATMTEITELRRELDEIRDRVVLLESSTRTAMGDASRAVISAREAERTAFRCGTALRDGFAKLSEDLAQLPSLTR